MSTDAASLDRLHDIVLPPEVSWWPLAPGWYLLLCLVFIGFVYFVSRFWRRWQADTYRRQALREITDMKDAPAIAELLRRTALAVLPRTEVAQMTGSGWVDWLAAQSPDPMGAEVRHLLTAGVYGPLQSDANFVLLRKYAVRWIRSHRFEEEKESRMMAS